MDTELLFAVIALWVPVALLALAVIQLLRLQRAGDLQRGLARVLFLRERRQRFVSLFLTSTTAFFIAGLVGALAAVGAQMPPVINLVGYGGFLAGSATLFLLFWLILQPIKLSHGETLEIENASRFLFGAAALARASPGDGAKRRHR